MNKYLYEHILKFKNYFNRNILSSTIELDINDDNSYKYELEQFIFYNHYMNHLYTKRIIWYSDVKGYFGISEKKYNSLMNIINSTTNYIIQLYAHYYIVINFEIKNFYRLKINYTIFFVDLSKECKFIYIGYNDCPKDLSQFTLPNYQYINENYKNIPIFIESKLLLLGV